MSDKQSLHDKRLSCRSFLYAAAGGGAVLAATLLPAPAAASAKVSQKSVQYQPRPNGKKQCDACALFQPPSSCKVVNGTINPSGSCMLFAPKA